MVLDQEQRPALETPALVGAQEDTAPAFDNAQSAAVAEAPADTAESKRPQNREKQARQHSK